jgi:phosphosulfolactate phosphohydrolase-like enzyme
VVIPAGLATDPDFFAQEDWAAGAWLLHRASELWPGDCSKEGAAEFARWQDRIMAEGLPALFATAPHAEKLRQIGLESDIAFCAKVDLYEAVPMAVQLVDTGIVLMKNASHRGWN